ncbi:MAG: hypothetical protein ACREBK_07730, partial [Sphingomicrobium sp.]
LRTGAFAGLDRTCTPFELRTSAFAGFDRTGAPFELRADAFAGFHPPLTPFGSLLAKLATGLGGTFSHLHPLLAPRALLRAFLYAGLAALGTLAAVPLGTLLAALGALAAVPLGLGLLGLLRPFFLLFAVAAALGLGRGSNGKCRHSGDQKCSGHGPVPVGGCLFKQAIILAKSS